MSTSESYASLADLARMLRSKQISSLELTRSSLRRLERYGPKLNSVVTLVSESALAQAAQADKEIAQGTDRGPLHGIPYGAKDLLAASGAPTTWGATPYREQRFNYNATVIDRLNSAGAVLVAKLAMVELAGAMGYNRADASFTGPCKTPWNLNYWSGGSSSGSGASVAAGLVPFALGSETDGSITNPASYCGVTGLRPTYGRVSRYGAMTLSWSLDKIGPLCRTAADTGTVLHAIAGYDPKDFTSSHAPLALPQSPQHWRIGVVDGTGMKNQSPVNKNFEASIRQLEELGALMHVRLPKFPYDAMVGAVIAAEGGSAFRDIIEDGRVQQLTDPDGRHGGYAYLVVGAVDYVDAMRQRAALRPAFEKLFANVDVIVSPTFSTVAPPIDITFDKAYPGTDDGQLITACNLVGYPAIAVPNGFGLHGLPTSLMFVGKPFAELDLVAVASQYQARTRFHLTNPPFGS